MATTTRSSLLFLALASFAACGAEGGAVDPAAPIATVNQPVSGGGGGTGGGGAGGGGGGADACASFQFYAPLYFVDSPVLGEPTLGGFVDVLCKRGGNLPADTTVTVNGLALTKTTDFFRASGSGPQLQYPADGMLHVAVASVSTGRSRSLDIPCAPLLVITSTPPVGSSLTGVDSVTLSWSAPSPQIPQNVPAAIAAIGIFYGQPTSALISYDITTEQPSGIIDQPYFFQEQTSATLLVRTQTTGTDYLAEITYPGPITFVPDLSTFGYCGRSARVTYAK